MQDNRLHALWRDDRAAVNGWLAIPDAFSAEIMARQGWDALTIDMQHGLIDQAQMVSMLQALATTAVVPVVRVPWLEPGVVMKALDAGALALICPMVSTRVQAQALVSYARYPPRGSRSFGPVRAGLVHGERYVDDADARVVVFAMIETAQALDQLDSILSVEGLDAVYVGPSDLSLALGCRPVLDDVQPVVEQAIEHIAERARAHGVKAGIHNGRPDTARRRIALGYRFVTVSSDARILAAGARELLGAMRLDPGG